MLCCMETARRRREGRVGQVWGVLVPGQGSGAAQPSKLAATSCHSSPWPRAGAPSVPGLLWARAACPQPSELLCSCEGGHRPLVWLLLHVPGSSAFIKTANTQLFLLKPSRSGILDALRKMQEPVGENTAAMKKQPGLNLKLHLEQKSPAMAAVQQGSAYGSSSPKSSSQSMVPKAAQFKASSVLMPLSPLETWRT